MAAATATPTRTPSPSRSACRTKRAGLRPGERSLCASLGLFADRYHATTQNEPRNGVMTALEDFLAGQAGRVGVASLPFLHGISLVHPRGLADAPALAAILQAVGMGQAAAALAQTTEDARLALAAEAADLRRAAEAAGYRNDSLHAALRERQLAMARKQVPVEAVAATSDLLGRVRRRARAARHAWPSGRHSSS